MFAADVLKVLYAPHKVFKQIIQNPKYWGPLLVILIFTGAQTGLFFAQYSKTYFEQTSPPIGQLDSFIANPSTWTSTSGAVVRSNFNDFINTTFYSNSSLEFVLTNSSSIFGSLISLNGSVDCGSTGFHDLFVQTKILEPNVAPSSVNLQLFSLGESNYFQSYLTSAFSGKAPGDWNNVTIPVGSGEWQSNGNPTWSNITGLKLTLTFPEGSNITLRIAGLFFRGLYKTPIELFSVVGFAANALFSSLFSFVVQWLALSVVFFFMLKVLKGTVTWKPLFIAIGFALVAMVIETLIILATALTLPDQIRYPFEFGYSFQLSYAPQVVSTFSTMSQSIYNSIIAPELATLTLVATTIALATYAWITLIGSAIVRAITDFTWSKSILASAASVVLTYIILSLLAAFGIV